MRRLETLKALLSLIPMGRVTSYTSLASVMRLHPRAVGRLLASNDELIKYPCHRVVRSDGSLGGYALGVEMKRKLLILEGVKFCGNKVCKESFVDLRSLLS